MKTQSSEGCFDASIPTAIPTRTHCRNGILILCFWVLGFAYPLIFRPQSFVEMAKQEHKKFPQSQKFKFDRYLNSQQLHEYIVKYAKFHREKLTVLKLTPTTFYDKALSLISIEMPDHEHKQRKKLNIVVLAGLSGKYIDSVSASIDILHKITEDCEYKVPYLLDFNWFIVPIANPDGYDYVLQNRDRNNDALRWDKNMNPLDVPQNPGKCTGVNLNRNFGFHWGESKALDHTEPCYAYFMGYYPFSENETRAISETMLDLKSKYGPIAMFVVLHGNDYRDEIQFPWRFTSADPPNYRSLNLMSQRVSTEVHHKLGVNFTFVQAGKRDLGSGVIIDWMMGIVKAPYTFSIEPTYEVLTSTEANDQRIYIEKVSNIVFGFAKQLKLMHVVPN